MFKSALLGVLFILGCSHLSAIQGEVISYKDDYYLVDTGLNCALIEKWKGELAVGDYVEGEWESIGFQEIYNSSTRSNVKVYVGHQSLFEQIETTSLTESEMIF